MTSRQRGWLLPPAALALVAGVFLGRSANGLLLPIIAFVSVLAAVFLLKGRLRFVACIATVIAMGACAGRIAFHPVLPAEGDYSVHAVISDEITYGSFGQRSIFLSDVTLNGRPLSGGAYWTFYSDEEPEDLQPGMTVSFIASMYEPGGADNPDGFDSREYLLQKGITVCLYGKNGLCVSETEGFSFYGTVALLRHRLSVALRESLGEETGSFASALLLGMRSLIPSEDRKAFASLGIAHILSVSGFHVGILISALAVIFRLLRLKQKVRIVLYILILFLYTALCGFSQPVIRASFLLLFSLEGRILNRPRHGIHLLCGVLFLMTLLSPAQVTSASFQFTFCAMFGLIWFMPLTRRIRLFRTKTLRFVTDSLVLTFGIQLGLLFPQLWFFQQLPLLVFFVNLPATLLFSILIVLFWLVMLLLPFPFLSSLLSGLLAPLTDWLLSGIRCLGSLPGLTLWIRMPNVFTALGVILVFFAFCAAVRFRRPARAGFMIAGALLVVCSLLPVPHTSTEYIQFSAGNADAAVLRDRDLTYVIDTGENNSILSGYLRARRLVPDAVIITHLHADHAGGLRSMIDDGIPVRLLYLPEGAENQNIHPDFPALLDELRSSGTEIRTLSRGDVLPLPSGTLAVLWPEKGKTRPGQDANNYSLACRISLRGTVLLHTGDLPGSYEHYCASPADLLKASHHGSPFSTGDSFLTSVSPDVILLSCRNESRVQDFRDRIGRIPVYATPECGAVTVRFEEGYYTVIPYVSH